MRLDGDCARSDGGGVDMSGTVGTPGELSRFLLCEDASGESRVRGRFESQTAGTVRSHCSINNQPGDRDDSVYCIGCKGSCKAVDMVVG